MSSPLIISLANWLTMTHFWPASGGKHIIRIHIDFMQVAKLYSMVPTIRAYRSKVKWFTTQETAIKSTCDHRCTTFKWKHIIKLLCCVFPTNVICFLETKKREKESRAGKNFFFPVQKTAREQRVSNERQHIWKITWNIIKLSYFCVAMKNLLRPSNFLV